MRIGEEGAVQEAVRRGGELREYSEYPSTSGSAPPRSSTIVKYTGAGFYKFPVATTQLALLAVLLKRSLVSPLTLKKPNKGTKRQQDSQPKRTQ